MEKGSKIIIVAVSILLISMTLTINILSNKKLRRSLSEVPILKTIFKPQSPEYFDEITAGDGIDPENLGELGTTKPSTGGAGGGGGGGAGGDGETPITQPGCIYKRNPYILGNFVQNTICNEYNQSQCIDKEISCSLTVQNWGETGGNFEIGFLIINKENSSEIDSTSEEVYLEANEIQPLATSFQVYGEIADKTIECSYKKLLAPIIEVC
ncbi:hypothetical protein GOV14_06125 [Candidatus Pacearchaeota archaeon]|nr:hypothetical protein [Candidatus Pacearchaeota archaeon]